MALAEGEPVPGIHTAGGGEAKAEFSGMISMTMTAFEESGVLGGGGEGIKRRGF